MKRVIFPQGKQKEFLFNTKRENNFSWKDLSRRLEVNESTLSKAYSFELAKLPLSLFRKIVSLSNKNYNKIIKDYNVKIIEGENPIGRKVFGELRKPLGKIDIKFDKNDLNLSLHKITYSKRDIEKKVFLPKVLTEELAEEIGMHLGDGFLSSSRNDYRLKGNRIDEKDYYINYVSPLYKKLFGIEISLKDYKTSYGFELSSRAIWEFKTKVIGIKTGKKTTISIPEVIKINNTKILCAFLRGLFDTDGCVSFKTKYGYNRYYPVISLSLLSKPLISGVGDILAMLGFNFWMNLDQEYATLNLSGIANFKRYEKLVGWSSPKNLNKVKEWQKSYPDLYNMVDVV